MAHTFALLGLDPRQPFAAFTHSSELVFLPYLLPAVAVIAIARLRTRVSDRAPLTASARRSMRNDLAMFALNGVFLFHILAAGIVAAPIAGWTRDHLRPIIGSHQLLHGLWGKICITLLITLVIDFSFFAAHVLQHRVPVLWCFHKVHHSAPVMTPLTAYRSHPVDDLTEGVIVSVLLGVCDGVLLLVFDPTISLVMIAGTNAVFMIGLAGLANLRHSHIWVSWGHRLEHVFCSPAQHQIHHSTDPRHHDRNFGGFLSLWDWLFGTLITARTREKIIFGLGAESDRFHTVGDMYFAPVREVAERWLVPRPHKPGDASTATPDKAAAPTAAESLAQV